MKGIGYFQKKFGIFLDISGNYFGIFWEDFFVEIFLEEFFRRNFLGGFFGRIFLGEDFLGGFFWEDILGGILLILELICLSRF